MLPSASPNGSSFFSDAAGLVVMSVGVRLPIGTHSPEDRNGGDDQRGERCFHRHGEPERLQSARAVADEDLTFQSRYQAPAMQRSYSQHGGEERQLRQQQLAIGAVE